MRYSMLVYMTNMCRTLLEAAQYLRTASDGAVRRELLDNGRQMLEQVRAVLEQHADDLRTTRPMELLETIERQWMQQNNSLEENLQQFIHCLPENVIYQVRAVFFAELGEKWDAMESVYEFMRDDPRFDPVVVRTPVGRVAQQNGERKQEIIYKDFLTPMGIPSLGFDQYSLEEDCPELAFISQPYESCTLEQFWPENIAKYTRLVYLPYFLPSIVLQDYPTTLCQMRVYDVAWKVIGANQKHYNYYCRHSHHGGANMIVTGVPKTDPIVRAKDHGVPLPSGWERLKGKKVFLWNSWFDIGVSSFRFFEEIFAWFQQHTDCALIWRPHPMTETVTKVYSPESAAYLHQCKERVENASNMVLDEETSFLAAFVYSYAQISDHSSMMQQYLPMDKPLLWVGIPAFGATGEEFISTQWMERAEGVTDILRFLERCSLGHDANAKQRKAIYQQDMEFADGCCGERVSQALWAALHSEDKMTDPVIRKEKI